MFDGSKWYWRIELDSEEVHVIRGRPGVNSMQFTEVVNADYNR